MGDWTDEQNDLIVAEYFAMMALIPTAERGMKARRKRDLHAKIGRKIGSIDFKLGNASAVARELGLPALPGFAPAPRFQTSVIDAFERYLDAHPEGWDIDDPRLLPMQWGGGPSVARRAQDGGGAETPAPSSGLQARGRAFADRPTFDAPSIEPPPEIRPLIIEPAPPPGAPRKPRPEGLERLVRKYNPAARDHRNRLLGRLGEEHVFRHEVDRLIAADRMDLAKKVEWTSQERGDGAGYDIRSFSAAGDERLIEVKATRGARSTPFFVTRTEREVSRERPDHWRLHRLYDLSVEPKLFRLKPPLEAAVTLEPETWRATVG